MNPIRYSTLAIIKRKPKILYKQNPARVYQTITGNHATEVLTAIPWKFPVCYMRVLPLHKHPEWKDQCCRLINDEWRRSESARMQSLDSSCDSLPTSLVMIADNNVIGHSKLSVIPSIRDGCLLESVVIDRALRGQGFGKLLMQKVEEYCRQIGLRIIYLSTSDKVEFYRKLGYVESEPVSIYGQFIRETNIKETTAKNNIISKRVSMVPVPPPMPQSLHSSNYCKKVFMSKVLS